MAVKRKKENRGYFEGWYLKQEKGERAAAFIPSFHRAPDGSWSASIQAVTNERSFSFVYGAEECRYCAKPFALRVGENYFGEKGIRVKLQGRQEDGTEASIEGRFRFGPFAGLRYDIMGPFRLLPFLQCNHGVLSMFHRVEGSLTVNGRREDYNGGRGYVEKDWGTSFPETYFWCQSSWEEDGACSVMVSAADIPLGKRHFPGCIAFVWHRGREYRLATYLGASICRCGEKEIVLEQGKYRLCVRVLGEKTEAGSSLRAPENGSMGQTIREKAVCRVQCLFYRKGQLLFDHTGAGSAEWVEGPAMDL